MSLNSWASQMELMDQWAEAGGTSNLRIAKPLMTKAIAMEKALRAAGVPHPSE
jgi:hypothetical protein